MFSLFIYFVQYIMTIIYILIIAAICFLSFYILKQFKFPKIGCLTLISGGVKCGKSTFSVALAIREHKTRVRKVKIKNFFRRLFGKEQIELPCLYSNVPLAIPYVPLTDDLLLRKKRFVYGSVVYCQEASLVADSQLIKDMDINQRLLLFNKLFGHETHSAVLIYDTQTISDLHYSIKRSLSEYFYIHHLVKWIPGFLVAYIIENRYSEDGTQIFDTSKDVEDGLKRVIIPKKTWKYFDCYCYSVLTDDLPVEKTIVNNNLQTKDLKARKILTFRKGGYLTNEKEND